MCERIMIPVMDGAYRRVYAPAPDVYEGVPTASFVPGTRYDDWIANDFSILKGADGCWHAFGITHPRPPEFTDAFHFQPGHVHEAEYQLFHAAYAGTLDELYEHGAMTDREKVLYPKDRPGCRPECHAPAVFRMPEGYGMVYAPQTLYFAASKDLDSWQIQRALFSGGAYMRDPFVFEEDGVYYILYNDSETLWLRKTRDFRQVSEPELLLENGFGGQVFMESPFLTKREGMYYLMWCVYDGQNGCYDNRTYVYAAPTLEELKGKAPLTVLRGHAPELVQSESGRWYIASVFYPENGLSLAPLRWEALYDAE